MSQFRICRSTYINEYGDQVNEYYYIQRIKSFLGIKYWSTIKHEVDIDWREITKFKTYDEAYIFHLKMSKGIKPDSWKDEVVSYV